MMSRFVNAALSARAWLRARPRACDEPSAPMVFYGFDHIPGPDEPIHGGLVKFQRMQDVLPNSPFRYNIVYLLSSALLGHAPAIAAAARHFGAKLVWNQNGVAFPAWHGPGYERTNAPMRKILAMADHVFYQSNFCRESADRFLGSRAGAAETLYNPIDTARFVPAADDPSPGETVLLAAGSHEQFYRVECAIRTLAEVRRQGATARLVVAGRLNWGTSAQAERDIRTLCEELGVSEHVSVSGAYTQADAPALMQQAHILVHAKCNDPCPGLVLEALACGLPVVYSKSGGTPELVGEDAGIGVLSDVTWDRYEPPAATAMAEAVLQIATDRSTYAEAARQRAVDRFDYKQWIARHRVVFEGLLS
jgi:glycosyltransferase involved in cell wall biosynthesis